MPPEAWAREADRSQHRADQQRLQPRRRPPIGFLEAVGIIVLVVLFVITFAFVLIATDVPIF